MRVPPFDNAINFPLVHIIASLSRFTTLYSVECLCKFLQFHECIQSSEAGWLYVDSLSGGKLFASRALFGSVGSKFLVVSAILYRRRSASLRAGTACATLSVCIAGETTAFCTHHSILIRRWCVFHH